MPSINTSDITNASDSTYFVDIARVKKFILTYLQLLCCISPDSKCLAVMIQTLVISLVLLKTNNATLADVLITDTKPRDYNTPVLMRLHWLPIKVHEFSTNCVS